MILEITQAEREIIQTALYDRAANLGNYATWITEHPDLPLREAAIKAMKDDRMAALTLAMRVRESREPAALG
jgi:hypothetical protein